MRRRRVHVRVRIQIAVHVRSDCGTLTRASVPLAANARGWQSSFFLSRAMDQLIARGVVVIPFLDAAQLAYFVAILAAWCPPELLDAALPWALGGFQALNLASGWHAPFVRELRALADTTFRPLLTAAILAHHGLAHLQQLADRLMVRAPGARVSPESYHRDSPGAHADGDFILGGWVNLDAAGTPPQRFICVPGTHAGVALPSGGFDRITDPFELADYRRREETILVPPGHAILFYSHLVHRVANAPAVRGAAPAPMRRLFIGWRATNDPTPLTPALERLLDEQAVIPLPSGQHPPLYPATYISYFDQNEARMRAYAARLHPHLTREHNSVERDGELVGVHKRTSRISRIPVKFALPLRCLPRRRPPVDGDYYGKPAPVLPADDSLAYPPYTAAEKHVLLRNS